MFFRAAEKTDELRNELANVIERVHVDQTKFGYLKSVVRERSKEVGAELEGLKESKEKVMKEVSGNREGLRWEDRAD